MIKLPLYLLAAGLAALPASAEAQALEERLIYPRVRELSLSVENGVSVLPEAGVGTFGFSYGLRLSLPISPRLFLEGDYSGSVHEPEDTLGVATLHSGALGLKLQSQGPLGLRPFISAGLGLYTVSAPEGATHHLRVWGVPFEFPVRTGLELGLSSRMSIGGALMYRVLTAGERFELFGHWVSDSVSITAGVSVRL